MSIVTLASLLVAFACVLVSSSSCNHVRYQGKIFATDFCYFDRALDQYIQWKCDAGNVTQQVWHYNASSGGCIDPPIEVLYPKNATWSCTSQTCGWTEINHCNSTTNRTEQSRPFGVCHGNTGTNPNGTTYRASSIYRCCEDLQTVEFTAYIGTDTCNATGNSVMVNSRIYFDSVCERENNTRDGHAQPFKQRAENVMCGSTTLVSCPGITPANTTMSPTMRPTTSTSTTMHPTRSNVTSTSTSTTSTSMRPTSSPLMNTTRSPTMSPSMSNTTMRPTMNTTTTASPTMRPTMNNKTTMSPSMTTTMNTTMRPTTMNGTMSPSMSPSKSPTMNTTMGPTMNTTMSPTMNTTMPPTMNTTMMPTMSPTNKSNTTASPHGGNPASSSTTPPNVGLIVALIIVFLLICCCVAAFCVWRRRKNPNTTINPGYSALGAETPVTSHQA